MRCQGKFKYKGITKRDGGSFTNSSGQVVNYSESYALKVDEVTDNGLFERVFKLPVNSPLISILSQKQAYDEIILVFEITLYASGAKVTPVDIINSNNK